MSKHKPLTDSELIDLFFLVESRTPEVVSMMHERFDRYNNGLVVAVQKGGIVNPNYTKHLILISKRQNNYRRLTTMGPEMTLLTIDQAVRICR